MVHQSEKNVFYGGLFDVSNAIANRRLPGDNVVSVSKLRVFAKNGLFFPKEQRAATCKIEMELA
jgi:hypothetical protein